MSPLGCLGSDQPNPRMPLLVAASARVAVAMATIGWLAARLALGGLLNAIAASPALFWVSVATVLFGLLPVGQAQAGGDW